MSKKILLYVHLSVLPPSASPLRLTFFKVPRWVLQFYNDMQTWQHPGVDEGPFLLLLHLFLESSHQHPFLSPLLELCHMSQLKAITGKGNWTNYESPSGLVLELDLKMGATSPEAIGGFDTWYKLGVHEPDLNKIGISQVRKKVSVGITSG